MEGDGKERQLRADVDGFCREYGFTLAKKTWFDEGVSAFDGLNWEPDKALGRFVTVAQRGVEVRSGDCLGVENWDRLSRADPWKAVAFVQRLRDAGIHLGDVTRKRLIRYDKADIADFFDFTIGVSRGHDESRTKAGRGTEAWKTREDLARNGRLVYTKKLPAWIEAVACEPDDPDVRWVGKAKKPSPYKLVVPEAKRETIHLIFNLHSNGYGEYRLCKELTERGIPSLTDRKWATTSIRSLLKDRRLLGEWQPKRRKPGQAKKNVRINVGAPIPDYFPQVLTESQIVGAKAMRPEQRQYRGRDAEIINIFQGLIKDALSDTSYQLVNEHGRKGYRRWALLNYSGKQGHDSKRSFSYEAFEEAVLSKLIEIHSAEILGPCAAADDMRTLRGKLNEKEEELAKVRKELRERGFNQTLSDHSYQLEGDIAGVKDELALAQHRAEHPLSEAWSEQQTLLDALRTAENPTQARLRLRARLRETIKQIWLLVVPLKGMRHAVVQINFTGEGNPLRQYMFTYFPGVKNQTSSRPSRWEPVLSWRPDGPWLGIDLSSPEQAAALGEFLASGISLEEFMASHSVSS